MEESDYFPKHSLFSRQHRNWDITHNEKLRNLCMQVLHDFAQMIKVMYGFFTAPFLSQGYSRAAYNEYCYYTLAQATCCWSPLIMAATPFQIIQTTVATLCTRNYKPVILFSRQLIYRCVISFQYIYIVHSESDFCRFSNVTYNFSYLGHFPYHVIPLFLEGEPPIPDQLPGEHTGPPSHMR